MNYLSGEYQMPKDNYILAFYNLSVQPLEGWTKNIVTPSCMNVLLHLE